MGMSQTFRSSATWNQATRLLDATFPLCSGSHATTKAYLVHFDHLLVVQHDGSITGLRTPGQFIEAGGDPEHPQSILLEQHGIQVEIEPAKSRDTDKSTHRMQLLTRID